jgi:hypothetical protein
MATPVELLSEVELLPEEVLARREKPRSSQRILFGVQALYGLSAHSITMPLNPDERIDSGQVCVTLDPAADQSTNCGLIDFEHGALTVRYGAQVVFPGLYKLVTEKKFSPSLLNPIRVIATDECSLTPDFAGWRALGCLEFLPGSLWAGTEGG